MTRSKPSSLLKAVPWFGGAFVGALVAIVLAKTPASAETENLETTIENLASAIAQLELSHGPTSQALQTPSPALERTRLDVPSLDELVLRLASLESILVTLVESLGESGGIAAVGQAFPVSSASEEYPMNVPALTNLKGQDDVDVAIGYLGWSYRQILQTFGSPSSVSSANSRVSFSYEDLPFDGGVTIRFRDGRVVQFYDDWDD